MKQSDRPKSTKADIVTAGASVVTALAAKKAAEAANELVRLTERANRLSEQHRENLMREQKRTNEKIERNAEEARREQKRTNENIEREAQDSRRKQESLLRLQLKAEEASRADEKKERAAVREAQREEALNRKSRVLRQLISAAKNGDYQMLDKILLGGIVCVDDSISSRNSLISAAESGFTDMVEHIWRKRDANITEALQLLCSFEGDSLLAGKTLVSVIVSNQAEELITFEVLEGAVFSGGEELLVLLLNAKKWPIGDLKKVGRGAYMKCYFSAVRLIQESGLTLGEIIHDPDLDINTFTQAAKHGKWAAVAAMINFNRDVLNIKTSEDLPPLLYFAKCGNEAACSKLIELGADESASDSKGALYMEILKDYRSAERIAALCLEQKRQASIDEAKRTVAALRSKHDELAQIALAAERKNSELIAKHAFTVQGIQQDLSSVDALREKGRTYAKVYEFISPILMLIFPLFCLGAGFKYRIASIITAEYSFAWFSVTQMPVLGLWFGGGVLMARLIADQNILDGIRAGLLSSVFLPLTAWTLWGAAHFATYAIGLISSNHPIAINSLRYLDAINTQSGLIVFSGSALSLIMAISLRRTLNWGCKGYFNSAMTNMDDYSIIHRTNSITKSKTKLKQVHYLYSAEIPRKLNSLKRSHVTFHKALNDPDSNLNAPNFFDVEFLDQWKAKDSCKIFGNAKILLVEMASTWLEKKKASDAQSVFFDQAKIEIDKLKDSFSPPLNSIELNAIGAGTLGSNADCDAVDYRPPYSEDCEDNTGSGERDDAGVECDDGGINDCASLVEEAIEVIRATRRASTSILERELSIDYDLAACIMGKLEQNGVVGPYNGTRPREILIKLD